ncbi:Microtubule-associated protein RP/EB family member 1A [Cocos nucifera]|uniref:Protein ATEB1 homolog 2 n=1 Tax=Cocos nucifera TaxID=13894 RepID=A0A8K0I9C3_COCNU|nr:Microtubule-associated protein RP/EB family member 1A [Cocos nucifera]
MAFAAANIGIMDGAYFVGRNEILSWINATLQLSLTKVEEAASGAVQCQMMDMVHPGVVPMHKVNFDAKTEYDMIQNYKLLQEVFNKLKIEKKNKVQTIGMSVDIIDAAIPVIADPDFPTTTMADSPDSDLSVLGLAIGWQTHPALKHIEVNKLVKGRPLDNLEFLQWLKRYCDSVNGGIMNENYNPVERRCKGGKERNLRGSHKLSKSLQANSLPNRGSIDGGSKQGKVCATSSAEISAAQIQELSEKIADLKLSVDNMEKERDFYFAKLRDIEILCQRPELEHLPMTKAICKILYAADAKDSSLAEAEELISRSVDPDMLADEAE